MENNEIEQWEYRTHYYCVVDFMGATDKLNALGKDGWEAYHVEHLNNGDARYYLKRRIRKGGKV